MFWLKKSKVEPNLVRKTKKTIFLNKPFFFLIFGLNLKNYKKEKLTKNNNLF